MTSWKLIARSLRFHARAHLGVVLGAAVGSAALIGALVVGDSVRGSLREMALARLGKIQLALPANDRLFRSELAGEISVSLQRPVAAVLQLPGTAATGDGSARANRVQVLGVDPTFWQLANRPPPLGTNRALVLNTALARHLNVKAGDQVLLRVQKPSRLSREAPISPQQNYNVALRLEVARVVSDAELGRFSLQANQLPPFNAFVPLDFLQETLDEPGRANLLLAGSTAPRTGEGTPPARRLEDVETDDLLAEARTALQRYWQPADSELELVPLTNSPALELRSPRVFLDLPVARAALGGFTNASGILTYFVNELRVGGRSTPYSMVAGYDLVTPWGMKSNEIVINEWLAEDLQTKAGDELSLKYFVPASTQRLEEREERFGILAVVPLEGAAADPELMPDFPGVSEAESSHDWDTGFPIDFSKIREKDEQYWEEHRGTPKAFLTLAAAQRLWTNRFGILTAVRYAQPGPSEQTIRGIIRRSLEPASVGLSFVPVRQQALQASAEAMDFGQLFLGFSFFLIVAALILVALLFQFSLERRAEEVGTLLALGFRPGQVRWLIWCEAAVLALIGGILGVAGGLAYARAMIYGLTTVWREAVAAASLSFHATPVSIVIGLAASVVVSTLTIALVLRKQARRPARELLAEGAESDLRMPASGKRSRGNVVGVIGLAGALGIVGWAMWQGEGAAAGAFFGAGALLLISGLGFCAAFLTALGRSPAAQRLSVSAMGLRSSTRRRKRSLASVALLACGSFMVVAVGANRLDADRDSKKRSSGTGGFALWGESSLPVVHDLNTEGGREFFGLDAKEMEGVAVVPFRVREGDEASCLNLNRAQTPRLLGIKPELLAERGAFTFAKLAEGAAHDNPWLHLRRGSGEAVPAIGDHASIQWAMGRKVGDGLTFLDERGNPFRVELAGGLANSILQGNLVIAEDEFLARFPSESGYRMFLIDAPSNRVDEVAATLTRALQDVGLSVTPTRERLAAFNAVQNTYLNTFQVLGGLGLLLGSAGLGVVVLRNVLERRGELALLQAVGFRKRTLQWLVFSEHGCLLALGLLVGIVAALLAILPVLFAPGAEVHYLSLTATLVGILASGVLWTLAATWLALRGRLLAALRNE